jgi:hypothetical protein
VSGSSPDHDAARAGDLVVAKHPAGEVGQGQLAGAEPLEQRPRLQHRPRRLQRPPVGGVAAQPGGEVVAVVLLDAPGLRAALPGPPAQLDERGGEGGAAAVVAA